MDFTSLIRTIPDYPKAGIQFRDITTLLKDANGFHAAINALAERYRGKGISKIVGIEARGFIFGAPLAYVLQLGFVPIRKQGKLPVPKIGSANDTQGGGAGSGFQRIAEMKKIERRLAVSLHNWTKKGLL